MTASIKTYWTKSNAMCAAKQAGYAPVEVEICITEQGAYYYNVVAPKEVLPGLITDADNGSEIVPAEAEHAVHRGEVSNKSTTERPCKRVWIIADDMLAANPEVKRKDVIAACIAAGVAFYTARTQYQQWLGVRKEMAAREAAKK